MNKPHWRGPLQELPLDKFLPSDLNKPPSPPKHATLHRSSKRPRSPGTPSFYSPAKRRILSEEGICTPKKLSKTPISAIVAGASHLSLQPGLDIPVKRLDFAEERFRDVVNINVPMTPSRPRLSPPISLNTTPKSRSSKTAVTQPADVEMADCFSPSRSRIDKSLPPTSMPLPAMITRDIPAPDRLSKHYPGFDIFHDLYETSEESSHAARPTNEPETPRRRKESEKENAAPRGHFRKPSRMSEGCENNERLGKKMDIFARPAVPNPWGTSAAAPFAR